MATTNTTTGYLKFGDTQCLHCGLILRDGEADTPEKHKTWCCSVADRQNRASQAYDWTTKKWITLGA